jgi:hypothetical protein
MPFVSKAQRRWMYKNHPKMAKEWESKTHGPLPDRKGGLSIDERIARATKSK